MTGLKGCSEQAGKLPKRRYTAPRFVYYGSVSELTQATKPYQGNDGNTKCTGNASTLKCIPS